MTEVKFIAEVDKSGKNWIIKNIDNLKGEPLIINKKLNSKEKLIKYFGKEILFFDEQN